MKKEAHPMYSLQVCPAHLWEPAAFQRIYRETLVAGVLGHDGELYHVVFPCAVASLNSSELRWGLPEREN